MIGFRGLACLAVITCSIAPAQENGINVGEPKSFDNRTLTIMLERLTKELATLRFVSQSALDQSFGLFQGSSSRDVARSLNMSGNFTPSLPTATASGATSATGGEAKSSDTKTESAKSDSISAPGPPKLPDLPEAPAFTPQYGIGPADLLSRQVELSYQVFNLQMALERSLTDRIQQGKPRLQAVLGFKISIEPNTDAKDAAAVVEVTVRLANNANQHLSLVAVMPQERTYNASALSRKANDFGGSAVASLFTIGYSERRRGMNFFVYRDTDTVSFQRQQKLPNDPVTFGWEFRPVLGRHSVIPAERQMFAVISLPDTDEALELPGDCQKDPKVCEKGLDLKVEVKTYWRNYDKDLLATKDRRPHTPHWWFQNSMPPERKECFETSVLVRKTDSIQAALGPRIYSADWFPSDGESGVISITGENFFMGTTVTLGGKTYATSDEGLLIKSDHYLQVKAPASAIGVGEPVLVGRYGPSIPIRARRNKLPGEGISLGNIVLRSLGNDSTEVAIDVEVKSAKDLAEKRDRMASPVLTIGSRVISGQAFETGVYENKKDTVYIRTVVPEAKNNLLGGYLRLVYPLWGPSWTAIASMPNTATYSVERLTKGTDTVILLITSDQNQFRCGAKIILDRTYAVDDDSAIEVLPNNMGVRLKVARTTLANFAKLAVIPNGENAEYINIPEEKEKPAPAVLEPATQMFTLNQNDSRTIVLKGKALDGIKSVQFEGKDLTIKPQSDNKELLVFLTRDVTEKAGTVQIAVNTSEGKTKMIDLTIKPGSKTD